MAKIYEILNTCWNFILTISVWDILDMLIIAFLIYKALTFVKKTNSANVIKGIIMFLLIVWLSSLLHLNVVNYLLGSTLEIGILVVIVLFQPEIRRILEQLGRSRFRGIFGRPVETRDIQYAISQTVIACADLAETRTGALIVFERDISLDSYIKTGTLIDASPSAELLKNIFYPKTPLHDGAVIIQDGHIAGAACMLPLSSNINLDRTLGMRHRAGAGMSERSDAVVVIVSEETGQISVAIDGIIKRNLSLDTLELLLRNELLPKEEERRIGQLKLRSQGNKNG